VGVRRARMQTSAPMLMSPMHVHDFGQRHFARLAALSARPGGGQRG